MHHHGVTVGLVFKNADRLNRDELEIYKDHDDVGLKHARPLYRQYTRENTLCSFQ